MCFVFCDGDVDFDVMTCAPIVRYGCWYVSRHADVMSWGEYAGAAMGVGLYSAVSITVVEKNNNKQIKILVK